LYVDYFRSKEIRVLRLPHRLATAAGTLAALGGVLVAGGLTPAGAVTAQSRATLYTVTFRGTNLAGRPDTGDSMNLFNVDNTRLTGLQTFASFQQGVATFHVPAGHYFGIGGFGATSPTAPAPRHVILPQVNVTGNLTVAVRESAASSEVTMATPRPATVLDTDVWLERTAASGPPLVIELYNNDLHGEEWLNPEDSKPTVGTLRLAVNQHLESPPGSAVPYEYTLSYTDPPGIIPAQHYVVAASQLATVHERFYQPVKTSGGWAFNGSLPGTNPNNNADWFGFIEPPGPSLAYPGQLTEYAGGRGTAAMEWFGQYEPDPGAPWLAGDIRLLHPGQQLTENWGAYPLHTAANVLLESDPNMFGATLPSASRQGNTVTLNVDPFDDNQPGHDIGWLGSTSAAKVTGTYQVDQNGIKIAGGSAVSKIPGPQGEFYTKTILASAKPSTIRFSLQVTRTGADYSLSNADRTVWTWHTAPPGAAKLPAGWTCVLYQRVSNCAVQPMLTLEYAVAGLSLSGAAQPGRQVLHLSVGHLQAAAASAITRAAVSVSFDGGKTWNRAKVTGHDGQYTAVFRAPAGAKVSLCTSAGDAAGGSVTETITSAYRIA
jgi:hypothetical protein